MVCNSPRVSVLLPFLPNNIFGPITLNMYKLYFFEILLLPNIVIEFKFFLSIVLNAETAWKISPHPVNDACRHYGPNSFSNSRCNCAPRMKLNSATAATFRIVLCCTPNFIPDSDNCQFWYTTTLFRRVKSTPKQCVHSRQNIQKRPKFCVHYAKKYAHLK